MAYPGVKIVGDLKLSHKVNKVISKTSSTLGIIHDLHRCSPKVKEAASYAPGWTMPLLLGSHVPRRTNNVSRILSDVGQNNLSAARSSSGYRQAL